MDEGLQEMQPEDPLAMLESLFGQGMGGGKAGAAEAQIWAPDTLMGGASAHPFVDSLVFHELFDTIPSSLAVQIDG